MLHGWEMMSSRLVDRSLHEVKALEKPSASVAYETMDKIAGTEERHERDTDFHRR